jgi:hypothetical protein
MTEHETNRYQRFLLTFPYAAAKLAREKEGTHLSTVQINLFITKKGKKRYIDMRDMIILVVFNLTYKKNFKLRFLKLTMFHVTWYKY